MIDSSSNDDFLEANDEIFASAGADLGFSLCGDYRLRGCIFSRLWGQHYDYIRRLYDFRGRNHDFRGRQYDFRGGGMTWEGVTLVSESGTFFRASLCILRVYYDQGVVIWVSEIISWCLRCLQILSKRRFSID